MAGQSAGLMRARTQMRSGLGQVSGPGEIFAEARSSSTSGLRMAECVSENVTAPSGVTQRHFFPHVSGFRVARYICKGRKRFQG